jgi:hypothetical protein
LKASSALSPHDSAVAYGKGEADQKCNRVQNMAHYRRKLRRRQRSCGMCKPYKRAGNSLCNGIMGRYPIKELIARKRFRQAMHRGYDEEL